jgi:16S rRNA (guanine527-N7)-methyltransferase
MDESRIAKLLAPFLVDVEQHVIVLSPAQLGHISMYIDILMRWNARTNLTAVRTPDEVVTRHFGESLFTAHHLFPGADTTTSSSYRSSQAPTTPQVIDVGSGAGFPGLPIKILAPQIHLTLIESNQKKATFLREVVRGLAMSDVEVFASRADAFPEARGDVVTIRAVERLAAILPIAAKLLRPAGRMAILVGAAQVKMVFELLPALKWSEAVPLPLSEHRFMILGRNEPG